MANELQFLVICG